MEHVSLWDLNEISHSASRKTENLVHSRDCEERQSETTARPDNLPAVAELIGRCLLSCHGEVNRGAINDDIDAEHASRRCVVENGDI